MRNAKEIIADVERAANFTATAPQQETWTPTARPQGVPDFGSALLAIAGHDLRQPLQVVQSAHELLGMGIRTSSELRHLRSGQNAIDCLKEQLAQLLIALRIREHTNALKLTAVRVQQVLRQACRENEEAALRKGISLRMVSSDAGIMSDSLFLGRPSGTS